MVQTRSASGVDVPSTPGRSRATTPSAVASSAPAATAAAATPRRSGRKKLSETQPSPLPLPTASTVPASAASAPSARVYTPASATSASPARVYTPASAASPPPTWVYTPDTVTLLWLAVSVPLVVWDTAYVLLRPHTMPGGSLHWPLWAPYALYGEVDHVYGFKQWNARNGFTAAQGALNAVETLLYLVFLYLWAARRQTTAARKKGLVGRTAAWAVLLVFSAAVMTLSKTVLYWLNEYYSDFDNIGHNDAWSLITLWIIPNGAWLVLPTYMIYVAGSEMLAVLSSASPGGVSKTD